MREIKSDLQISQKTWHRTNLTAKTPSTTDNMFGYGGYGLGSYGGFDDGRPSYGSYAEKSAAALKREASAIALFDAHRLSKEASPTANDASTTQLLTPDQHLTEPCWKTFAAHVRRSEGWNVKKRRCSEEEKRAAGETRRGTVAFVDAIFKGVKVAKPKGAAKTKKEGKENEGEGQEEPQAPKAKKTKL